MDYKVNLRLDFAKDKQGASGLINYALGVDKKGREKDKSRLIRWESWNVFNLNNGDENLTIESLIAEWHRHVDDKMRLRISAAKRGRPAKKTAVMITINDGVHVDFFKYLRDGIWNWVQQEFYDYMGIMSYHFKGDGVHPHIIVNPVPLANMESAPMLRITPDDEYYRNSYIDARDQSILRGFKEISAMINNGMDDGGIFLPLFDGSEYIEAMRSSKDKLIRKLTHGRNLTATPPRVAAQRAAGGDRGIY